MEDKVKKKKKKSLSAQIKELRERNNILVEASHNSLIKRNKMEQEIECLRKLLPMNCYEVKFKAMAKSQNLMEYTHYVMECSSELAIKNRDDICSKFELIYVKQLTTN